MLRRQAHCASWLVVRLRAILLATFLALVAGGPLVRADSIDEVRDSVRTPYEPTAEHRSDEDRRREAYEDDSCYADGCCDDWSFSAAALLVAAPFYLPRVIAEDSFARAGYFPSHPYQYDVGYMLIDPIEALGMEGPRHPYPWAARARAEYGTTFNGTDWVGGSLLVESGWRLGLDTEFRELHEELAPGVRDNLWLGDANIHFRFAQSETLQVRSGIGLNYLTDDRGSDAGFNFTYGGDWYPAAPWVLSSEIDAGWLGHAGLFHFRTTVGAAIGPAEAYAGYDFYDIGRAQFSGLVAGVRFWF